MNQIWQSNLNVSMTQHSTKSRQHYEIVLKTDNDDMSRSPHLIFSLPRNSVLREIAFDESMEKTSYQVYGNKSQVEKSEYHRVDGYVKVDFRNLNHESVSVKLSIAEVGEGWKENDGASVFVFSLTPELDKQNNFVYLPLP